VNGADNLVPPSLRALVELWPLLTAIGVCVFGGAILYLGTRFVTHKAFEECRAELADEQESLADRMADCERHMRDVEAYIKSVPTSKAVSGLEINMERLAGRMEAFEATLKGQEALMKRVERQLNRVDDFLRQPTNTNG